MELKFEKVEGANIWEAQTVVADDYAIHVELEKQGALSIQKTSVEGTKSVVMDSVNIVGDLTYDQDYDDIVYPKYLTLRTTAPVSKAYIIVKS